MQFHENTTEREKQRKCGEKENRAKFWAVQRKGRSPGGSPKGGALKGGGSKGWGARNFALFSTPATIIILFSSLGGRFVEFWL